MQKSINWVAVFITVFWIAVLALAFHLAASPNIQDVAPQQCEQVGNC